MPQISDISLADSASTAQSFAVVLKDGLTAKWAFNNGSPLSMRPTISMKMRPENASSGIARKTAITAVLPYSETVDSVSVTKYATARLEFNTPESATALVVADLLSFAKEALDEAIVAATITDGTFPH